MSDNDLPIDLIKEADAFRRTLIPRADTMYVNAPLWHGWAIFDAYVAGVMAERNRASAIRALATPERGSDMDIARAFFGLIITVAGIVVHICAYEFQDRLGLRRGFAVLVIGAAITGGGLWILLDPIMRP